MATARVTVSDARSQPIGELVTVRGKELQAGATVAAGRALFDSSSVRLIPVLDGGAYTGAVTRDAIADAADAEPITAYAGAGAPVATASTPLEEAMAALDGDGGFRLVVVGDDGRTYVGLLCLNRDREHLCVDAECHRPDRG